MKSKTHRKDQKCRSIRNLLFAVLRLDSEWVQSHIANCPRCQKRLARTSKVNIAIMLIKNQPHKLDLLSRANEKTVAVLQHSIRNSSKADRLKKALPKPTVFTRLSRYRYAAANIAACVAILLMIKTGIFPSVERFQNDSKGALKYYYTVQAGEEVADEIFPS